MAIARLSMKVGKAGKAGPHAAYIAREGQYAGRLERGERLDATEAGNMPAWAQSNPLVFWQEADACERKNGTTYREMEIALPRELDTDQRAAMVREFVRQEIGDRHTYQWAIHVPTAADGQEQPHVHLMFSERQRDGIERDPEQYFRRYNAKAPEKGGAKKGYGPHAGQTLTKVERIAELKALRGRWGALCNAHLERAGIDQRIDMRSHAERGTGLDPERKQLPSEWRGHGRANVIEFRQARAELAAARQELARVVPDVRAEIISLEAERKRREQAERRLLERMSAAELAAEIARQRPPPVRDLVDRDPIVIQADQECRGLEEQCRDAQIREHQAMYEAGQWRERHKVQAWLHDRGIGYAPKLRELEQQRETYHAEGISLVQHLEDAALRERHARGDAEARITIEQAPIRDRVAELEELRQVKARQEQEEKRKAKAARLAEREWAAVPGEFRAMAQKREYHVAGWSDQGSKWQAVPEALRTLIDGYNAAPKAARPAILDRLMSDSDRRDQVRELMAEQRTRSRDNSRGMSR